MITQVKFYVFLYKSAYGYRWQKKIAGKRRLRLQYLNFSRPKPVIEKNQKKQKISSVTVISGDLSISTSSMLFLQRQPLKQQLCGSHHDS